MMKSFTGVSCACSLPLTSTYTVLQPISETSVPFIPAHKPSSSWRKFIRASAQQPVSEASMTFIPATKTTTEGPIILKAASLPDDYEARVEEFLHFIDSLQSQTEVTGDMVAEQ